MNSVRGLVLGGAMVVCGTAAAGLHQGVITPPGGFVQAGAYPATGSGCIPGQDLQGCFGVVSDFHEMAYAHPGSAGVSASFDNGTIMNSGSAESGMGYLKLHAFDSSPSQSQFPIGSGNGGWKETFTVSEAAHNGQAGFFLVRVRVQGTFHAQGAGGSASVIVNAYKNNLELLQNAHFDPGDGNGGGSNQRVTWGVASFNTDVHRDVSSTVTFAAPITFGQSFSLGIYGLGLAGQRASGGFNLPCIGEANLLSGGVTWAGIAGVLDASGAAVSGSTIISGSGIDWSGPYTSCGSADFDGDGDVGTDADIEAFFACLSGNCCPTCDPHGADFNGDGDVGTDADIESFFRVLAGGPC